VEWQAKRSWQVRRDLKLLQAIIGLLPSRAQAAQSSNQSSVVDELMTGAGAWVCSTGCCLLTHGVLCCAVLCRAVLCPSQVHLG
jgi:hypothetical protein